MTTDPVIHAMQAAQACLSHSGGRYLSWSCMRGAPDPMRIDAAHFLRTARSLAGEHAWTVQDLRDAWSTLKPKTDQ